jgi:hypothetical protein
VCLASLECDGVAETRGFRIVPDPGRLRRRHMGAARQAPPGGEDPGTGCHDLPEAHSSRLGRSTDRGARHRGPRRLAGATGRGRGGQPDPDQGDRHPLEHLPRGAEAASLDRRQGQSGSASREAIGEAAPPSTRVGASGRRAGTPRATRQLASNRWRTGSGSASRRPPRQPDGDDRMPAGRGAGAALERHRRSDRDYPPAQRHGARRWHQGRRRAPRPRVQATALRPRRPPRAERRPPRRFSIPDEHWPALGRDGLAQLPHATLCAGAKALEAGWDAWRRALPDPSAMRESVTGLARTRPYDLGRHTHSALMLASGMSLQRLARIQGHGIRVLDDAYSEQLTEFEERSGRIDPEREIEAARRLVANRRTNRRR